MLAVCTSYTNVAVLGSYVTLIAGQTLLDNELCDYDIKRVQTFHTYTTQSEGFQEYNRYAQSAHTALQLWDTVVASSHIPNRVFVRMCMCRLFCNSITNGHVYTVGPLGDSLYVLYNLFC